MAIIELFGPPGVGKTTFAVALGARLREGGRSTQLYLSSRPGEEQASPCFRAEGARAPNNPFADSLKRVVRPVMQLIAAKAVGEQAYDASVRALAEKLPRGSRVAALRMRQYLVRLSSAWHEAQMGDRTAIFDQAYVQAIASILVARGFVHEEDVEGLIAIAPRSDLVIKIDASIAEVEARLEHRAHAIGRIGRLFESKLGGPVAYTQAAARLQSELLRVGRAVINVSSADAKTLRAEVERVYDEIERARYSGAAA